MDAKGDKTAKKFDTGIYANGERLNAPINNPIDRHA